MRASQARPAADPRTCGDPRRGPAPRRAARPRLLAALAVAAALVCAPTTPAAFAADDPTPAPSGAVDVFVSAAHHGVLESDEDLTAHVALRNGTSTVVAETKVTLRLGSTALTSRAQLADWLDSGTNDAEADDDAAVKATPASPDMTKLGTTTLDDVDAGTTASADITVAADEKALTTLDPGIYPIEATITGPSQTRVATSVLTVPRTGHADRTPVAMVVPITAGPLEEGLLTSDELEALTAPEGELTADLNAVAGTSAILAIDPAIPASIRVLGTSAPDSAVAWLDRLELLSNERFALQFGDADIAVQLKDGHASLLHPTTLDSYMDAADFADTADAETSEMGPTPTPTGTATPGVVELPTIDQLEYLGQNTRDDVYWPFSGTAGSGVVSAVTRLPGGERAPVTLIGSASASPGTAHAQVAGDDVLVYDTVVSDALRTASTQDDPMVRGSSLAAVTAYLTLAARSADGAPLLVAVDRAAPRSGLGLSAAVEAVTGVPGTTSTTLSRVLDSPARDVTVRDAAVNTTRRAALRELLRDQQRISDFATILDDPSLLTAPERASILQLLGSGWLGDADAWDAAVAAHRKATTDTLDSVSIAPSSDFNLAGRVATRSFGIRNDLPWPVNVTLLTHPDNLRLEVQESTEVVAHASSTTAAHVPIQAKIGNGDVTLNLRLISPTGVAIGHSRSVVVTVHADWEVIGLVILGVGIGAFLVVGVARTVLSRRRRRADAAADDAAPDAQGDAP